MDLLLGGMHISKSMLLKTGLHILSCDTLWQPLFQDRVKSNTNL